jgi:hypothetical protein
LVANQYRRKTIGKNKAKFKELNSIQFSGLGSNSGFEV